MTRRVLAVVGEVHAGPLATLTLALIACALLPFTLLVDGMAWFARDRRVNAALSATEARCPRGHRVPLVDGTWTCSCKFVFAGHAWTPCPACGAVSSITCPCGLTIRSPLEGLM